MTKPRHDIEITVHELPDVPLDLIADRIRALSALYPAPLIQIDGGGIGKMLLDRLADCGAKPLPKGLLGGLIRRPRTTYAEEYVRQYAEMVAKRVHVERDVEGNAVISFRGRKEVVSMQIEVEPYLRSLSEAVDRLFQAKPEEDKPT